MPKELEKKLAREAKKKGLKGKHADAYIYGTMRETGWTPDQEKKPGGMGAGPAWGKK